MAKLILSLFFLLFVGVGYAQKTADTNESISIPEAKSWLSVFEKRQDKFIKMLGLTDSQRRSLDTVNDDYVVKRSNLFDEKGMNRRDRKDEIKDLRREQEQKFRTLLSSEQLQKWAEFKKRQKKKILPKK